MGEILGDVGGKYGKLEGMLGKYGKFEGMLGKHGKFERFSFNRDSDFVVNLAYSDWNSSQLVNSDNDDKLSLRDLL